MIEITQGGVTAGLNILVRELALAGQTSVADLNFSENPRRLIERIVDAAIAQTQLDAFDPVI